MALAELVERSTRSDPYSEGYAFIRVRGAFSPDLIEARAGERLRLIFRREETAECSERIIFPSLGRSVMLPPFEDVAIHLGPLPRGSHPFSCELGVLRGSIVARRPRRLRKGVRETTDTRAAVSADASSRRGSYAPSDKELDRKDD